MEATANEAGPESVSDEELQGVTIGEVTPHNAPITLAGYDPQWPQMFQREADRIRSALGEAALRIEHVGSTSVPGLVAKPIIDILLVVADTTAESSYLPALENAGYVLRIREPDWFEHRLLKGPDTNINMHVFSAGTAEINQMIAFRDRLRDIDEERDLYARTKRELATHNWRHVQHYADAKAAVVKEILSRTTAAAG